MGSGGCVVVVVVGIADVVVVAAWPVRDTAAVGPLVSPQEARRRGIPMLTARTAVSPRRGPSRRRYRCTGSACHEVDEISDHPGK
jgi:hypothetical protein